MGKKDEEIELLETLAKKYKRRLVEPREELVVFTVKVKKDLLKDFRRAVEAQGLTIQEAIAEALKGWLR